jgi:hypothetical protein
VLPRVGIARGFSRMARPMPAGGGSPCCGGFVGIVIVGRLLNSGGSVSSPVIGVGSGRARPEPGSRTRKHDGTTGDLVKSPDLTRARRLVVAGRGIGRCWVDELQGAESG